MITISPLKVLIVLVVALLLLGPDKVPQAARQIGAGWSAFRKFRQRMEEEIRDTVPDLPAAHEIVRAVRSPMSFLDNLADLHGDTGSADAADTGTADTGTAGTGTADTDSPDASERGGGASRVADEAEDAGQPHARADGRSNGSAAHPAADPKRHPVEGPDAGTDADRASTAAPDPVAETPSGAARSYRFTVPDDPSLN